MLRAGFITVLSSMVNPLSYRLGLLKHPQHSSYLRGGVGPRLHAAMEARKIVEVFIESSSEESYSSSEEEEEGSQEPLLECESSDQTLAVRWVGQEVL